MKSNMTKEHANEISRAMRRTTSILMKNGAIEPYCELDCSNKRVIIVAQIDDVASKDRFVHTIRATAHLQQAHRVAFVAETWGASAGWIGRPSDDPNRSEALAILVEDALGHSQTIVEIKRAHRGHIVGLGSPTTAYKEGPNTSKDRFARLLPPTEAHDDDAVLGTGAELLRKPVCPGLPPGVPSTMTGRA